MNKNHPIHINIPITKIDEEQRMVWGYATVEEIDAHGEIIGYQASKKAFPEWLGNIREMHGPTAIGKSIEITFDDDNKGVWLGSYISESADGENAWIKVKEGILQAYSIGGNIKDFKMVKGNDGNDHLMVTDYDLFEVSLVDNPACPSATLQVVKSIDGGLCRTEKIQKGSGRMPAWWESRFNFSPSQEIIKHNGITYNRSSMTKSRKLAKDIWSAYELVDLAACLSSYIWMEAYEGEDVTDLKVALATIQAAAADEILEPAEFPEPVAMAVENALKALNITKVEDMGKMIDTKNNIEKGNVIGGEERDADGKPVVAKPVAEVETEAEPVVPAEEVVETPAIPEETEEPVIPGETEESAAAGESVDKSNSQGDMVKAILAGVEASIEKAVSPLKAEIDRMKKSPAASKRATSYTDVEKVEKSMTEQDTNKAEFDSLLEKAAELSAHPEKGSLQDRIALGLKMRKLSRLMDPASRAQHAAIRASFNQGQ